jgi:hypothetical protein
MARALFVRIFIRVASAIGLFSLSLLFVGLIAFVNPGPSAGAGVAAKPPATSVNREFKSDRLLLPSDINSAFSKNEARPSQGSKEIPDGCDRSFSPITAPQLAYVYGRCTT